MKAFPFNTFSRLLLLAVFAAAMPGQSFGERLLGAPVDTTKREGRLMGPPVDISPREGRLLGAPTSNNPVRPIQRGFDPASEPVEPMIFAFEPTTELKSTLAQNVQSSPPVEETAITTPTTASTVEPEAPEPIALVSPVEAEEETVLSESATVAPLDEATPAPTPAFQEEKTESEVIVEEVVEVKEEIREKPIATPSWQKMYRLGPGDVLNFSLYLRPELTRAGVVIAPDGSVSYLQAISIPAEGRTIDQLKWAMEHSLSEYHKEPQVIITPAVIGSKQFSIIGRVREPGSYSLDRPTTVLEGMAMAQGVSVGTVGGYLNEIADMHHSFVARGEHKLDIDLAALYHEGDFSQNAFLEPNDYIYIASVLNQEYYILGYVNDPGRKRMSTKTTLARAVAEASGYDAGAWQKQVLLVRGSIHRPETTVVDLREIIKGKAPDIEIESGDIIYVRERPTRLIEEAVDEAIFTFVQTATAEAINEELTNTIDAGQ